MRQYFNLDRQEVNNPEIPFPPAYSAPPQAAPMGHVQDPQPITGAGGSMIFGRPGMAGGAPQPELRLCPHIDKIENYCAQCNILESLIKIKKPKKLH